MKPYSDHIINTIQKYLPTTEEAWELLGFVNRKQKVYPFGTDSKIIGRLFEVIVKDSLEKAADELGYELHESEKQTVYPDFYFSKPGNPKNGERIAVDIKTTYRKSPTSKFNFTGGSFTSFMRNNTKNIDGKYSQYSKHYILGIVYTRVEDPTTKITDIDDIESIIPAYTDVEVFVQEKYRICGDKKGSGNTDNIATIKANSIQPFQEGWGPFAFLGKDVFHDYWVHYPKYKDSDETKNSLYTDLPGYLLWLAKRDSVKATELTEKYNLYLKEAITEGAE